MASYRPRMMKKDEYESLKVLLEYSNHDERNHWIDVGKPDDHVYTHILRLQEYVDKCIRVPKGETE